jgi:hypothetical protein
VHAATTCPGVDVTLFLLVIFLAGFLLYAAADIRRKQDHVDLHREIRAHLSSMTTTESRRHRQFPEGRNRRA